MSIDINSLLNKSSGKSFGELAANYFSQNNKKSNRSRNLLLASLVYSGIESRMRSNVAKNLQDLADNDVIERAKLANQFKKRTDLETAYNEIQRNGALAYYETLAEKAFQDANLENSQYANLPSGAIAQAKNEWKTEWANTKAKQEVLDPYKNIDPTISTLEGFSKEYNDYYKAQKREIASPKNVSLVHNLFSKIGIGGKPEGRMDKATKNFITTVEKEREEYNTQQQRVTNFTDVKYNKIKKDGLSADKLKGLKLDITDFNTLINQSTLNTNTEIGASIARAAKQKWREDGETLSAAINAITSYEEGYTVQSRIAARDKAISGYELINPKPNNPTELDIWEQGKDKAIRDALGITNLTKDRQYRANQLYNIAVEYEPGLERDNFIKKVLQQDVLEAVGAPNVGEIKSELMSSRSALLIELYGDKDQDTLTRRDTTVIDTNFMKDMSNNYTSLYNKIEKDYITDGQFDVSKFNSNTNLFTQEEVNIIRNYQMQSDVSKQTETAYFIAEEVGNSILKLSLSDNDPLGIISP